MFQGFTEEAVSFLEGIRDNNNREWFLRHKQQYLEQVKAPMEALVSQLFHEMVQKYPDLRVETHVSRIYKDFRRVRDGRYCNESVWLLLRDQYYDYNGLCYYFKMDAVDYSYGLCLFQPSGRVMQNFRSGLTQYGDQFLSVFNEIAASGLYTTEGELYKREKNPAVPALYEWYQKKDLVFRCKNSTKQRSLYSSQLLDQLLEGYGVLMPLYQLLSRVLPKD